MRILIAEDDVHLVDMLREALSARQYVVDTAEDGESAWHWLKASDYDLVLLDVTLPKLDGIRLCQRMRNLNYDTPVLMLTARDTVADKISGLDAGADAYMIKPFDLEELLAQIRALLRRSGTASHAKLYWGSLCLDATTYEVTYAGQSLSLTRKEFFLLELLLANGRKLLSRPGIIDRLWSLEDSPTEEAVKTLIRTLRQKLRNAGAPADLVETVHGLGYRMKQLDQ